MTAALVYQVKLITFFPLGEHFQVGFYHWEKQADGSRVRWMGQRAAIVLKDQPGKLLLEIRAPLPDIEKHPQQVRLTWGKEAYHLTLRDREWTRLALPVNDSLSSSTFDAGDRVHL